MGLATWQLVIFLIDVIFTILCSLSVFIGYRHDKENGIPWEFSDKYIFTLFSFVPVFNIIIFFCSLYFCIQEVLPTVKEKRLKQKNKKINELTEMNKLFECLECGVYTRNGHIDIFNITNDEKLCPNCEYPLNIKSVFISNDIDLPFARKFTLSDLKNIKDKTDKELKDNLIKEQNERYLKAREMKVRKDKEKANI